MEGDRPVLRYPQDGESLKEYLQKFSDTELLQIIKDPDLLKSFSKILQEGFKDIERTEDELEKIWKLIESLNNFERLQRKIQRLRTTRKSLLELLERSQKEIEQIFKYCVLGRAIGSTVDIAGTVGGLWLKEYGSPYAKLMFGAATSFGLLGFVSTVYESTVSKNMFKELMLQIQKDQQLMDSIKRWYQQCDELDEAMRDIFPFHITDDRVRSFGSTGEVHFTPIRLLSTLITAIAQQNVEHLRDERVIRTLIIYTTSPHSQDWWEWMVFHPHPVMMDITRILLQLQTRPSFAFALCQNIPALPIADQNMKSYAVAGRLGLNLVSLYDAITTLRSSRAPVIASAIGDLREHLASEMKSLERIVEFVQSRKKRKK